MKNVLLHLTSCSFRHGFIILGLHLQKNLFRNTIYGCTRKESCATVVDQFVSKHYHSNHCKTVLQLLPVLSTGRTPGFVNNIALFSNFRNYCYFTTASKTKNLKNIFINMEGDTTKAMLVTANVGSIFEEPETMFPSWLSAFYQCLNVNQPSIVALHCQEVGGKNYEASMQHVNHFIKTLLACEELQKYDRARIILDEDYTASDKFTALGSLYFIHQDVPNVLIWDFVDCKFIEVEGREVLSGNIENVPIKEKAKFPQHFFPEFKWSRKGFLRTRWSVNNCIFDLVNIHLFHDASNIVAMQSSPSVYAENRQRALLHTLQRFENDKYSKVPLFIFGDFNFRLDSNLLIQELTSKLVAKQFRGKKDQVNKIEYTEEGNGKVLLTIGSKSFDYYEKHSDLFSNMNKWLHQYDTEFQAYREQLMEFEISFPPSYPFCENVKDGVSYMKTRVPSWCDRILLTHSAKDIIVQDLSHPVLYDIIGKESCMGDHKPVYLFFHIKPGKGKSPAEDQTLLESSTTSELLRSRARTLSINGELVGNVDMEAINIHDYAVFEQEQNLIEEFRESIKNKASKDSDGDKKRSFQDVVRDVRTMEKVLKQWPGRSLDRHHSSSSEDYPSDDSEGKSLADGERDDANSVEASPLLVDHNENCRVVHNLRAADIVNSGEGVQANAVSERDVEVTLVGGTQGSGGCRDTSSGKAGVVMLAQHDDGVHVESSNPPASSNPVNLSAPTPKAELSALPGTSDIIIPSTQVKISEVDTTRYIHIRQGESSTRVFRETSV